MNFDIPQATTKLKELTVSNYRSFKEPATIELKPVTLLFGGNSSGKTSLLKLFPYLNEATSESSWSHDEQVNLNDIIYQKKEGGQLTLKYTIEHSYVTKYAYEGMYKHHALYNIYIELELVDVEHAIKEYIKNNTRIKSTYAPFTNESRYDLIEKRVIIDEQLISNNNKCTRLVDLAIKYEGGDIILEEGRINMDTPLLFSNIEFSDIDEQTAQAVLYNVQDIQDSTFRNIKLSPLAHSSHSVKRYHRIQNIFMMNPNPAYEMNVGDGLFRAHKNILNIIGQSLKEENKNTSNYLLKVTKIFADEISFIMQDFFENLIPIYIRGIREVLTNNNDLHDFLGIRIKFKDMENEILNQTNEYLGNKFLGAGYKVVRKDGLHNDLIETLSERLKENEFSADALNSTLLNAGFVKRYELYDTITETPVSNSEVGLGIVQVLPIVANMAAHENALIIIEQPELHLHPAQQSKLAQLMIENHRTHQNRFMIETHSEHFIKTLQLEIAKNASAEEPSLTKDDVQILYCNKSSDHKGSTLRKIELTADGSFAEPWPDNFFDVSADITLERLRLTNRN